MNLTDGLNAPQQEAVTTVNGPLLLLAGAGSGKTKTIIHRIAYIIDKGYAPAYRILALTFTNKAAREMKDRIESLGIYGTNEMWMGTFHSIFARLLRIYAEKIGFTRNFTIYDETDSKSLITKIMDSMNISDRDMPVASVKDIISKAKDAALTPKQFTDMYKDNFRFEKVGMIYEEYQKSLKQNNAMDFDDLLFNTIILLKENADILQHLQDRFEYILIDEYQDTNHLQYEIIHMLSEKKQNICVCGDDDQSIYGWRGADIRNILDFEDDYPNAKVIRLEQNYRSSDVILNAANAVIRHNSMRKGKDLWTEKKGGEKIHVLFSSRDLDESNQIAREITALHNNGVKYSDIAILYRINAQSRILEEGLLRKNIPYQIIGGTRFYDRAQVKDILSYLKLAANHRDSVSFARAVSAPKRGVGATSLEKLMEYASFKNIDLLEASMHSADIPTLTSSVKKKLFDFANLILDIYDTSEQEGLARAVEKTIEDSGYENMIRTGKMEKKENILELLHELTVAAEEFEDTSEDTSLEAFLENAALITSAEMLDDADGKVQLMTMHNSKGLEFDVVFIPGMEENLFPSFRAKDSEKEMEEERRLCYVAITRARKKLYVSHTQYRKLYGAGEQRHPSIFLSEIPQEYTVADANNYTPPVPKKEPGETRLSPMFTVPTYSEKKKDLKNTSTFNPGDKIRHPSWGEGTVVSKTGSGSDEILTVAFAGIGIKKIITGYAKIEKI